jgi:hypothetical protein
VLNKDKCPNNSDDNLLLSSSDQLVNINSSSESRAFRFENKSNRDPRSGNPNFVSMKIGVFEFFAKVETVTNHSDYFQRVW